MLLLHGVDAARDVQASEDEVVEVWLRVGGGVVERRGVDAVLLRNGVIDAPGVQVFLGDCVGIEGVGCGVT